MGELEKGSHLGRSIAQYAKIDECHFLVKKKKMFLCCWMQPVQPHNHSFFGPTFGNLPLGNSCQSCKPLTELDLLTDVGRVTNGCWKQVFPLGHV